MTTNFKNYFSVLALIFCAIFTQNSNAQCTGSSNVSIEADPFVLGYNYSFKTVGTDVIVTVELLDVKDGVVAYIRKPDPGFHEYLMTPVNGKAQTFTYTYQGQTLDQTITRYFKFAYAAGPGSLGMAVTKTIDYKVGDCPVVVDDQVAPVGFTATIGAITATSIELVLNGTDDKGTVIYNVTGGAVASAQTSGEQKSLIIKNLTPQTAYSFSVTAKDPAGNFAANSPITGLTATTAKDSSTPCAGTSSIADQGTSFSTGYDYSFTTANDSDVTVTFKLLDTDKTGVVAYVFKMDADDANFSENGPINPDASNTISKTFTGLTKGTVYKLGVKFAYAGGAAFSKYFTYTVGDACTTLGTEDIQLSSNDIKLYPNPANKGIVTIEAGDLKVSKIEVYSVLGAKVLQTKNANFSTSNLQSGIYFVKISAEGKSVTKKLIVN